MRSGPWHIFHFIGHGGFEPHADEGVIALVNDDGKTHLLRATELGQLLANHDALRLVILNACEGAKGSPRDIFSSTAATLARRGIPAVLAMQYAITDRAAIECSRAFYEALADSLPVDAALAEARLAINTGITHSLEWGIPVLFMRAPDGTIFQVERSAHRQAGLSGQTGAALASAAPPSEQTGSPNAPLEQAHGAQASPTPESGASFPASKDGARGHPAYSRRAVMAGLAGGVEIAAILGIAGAVAVLTRTPVQPGGVLIYRGHDQPVYTVAWSPDGTRIASASLDGSVQIWEASTGRQLFKHDGYPYAVWSVAWSLNHVYLAAGSEDTTVQVWQIPMRAAPVIYRGHKTPVQAVAWAPLNGYIGSGSTDGVIQVWRPMGPAPSSFVTYQGHKAAISAIAWAPKYGSWVARADLEVASASADKTVQLWDGRTGQPLLTYQGHSDQVLAVDWSPTTQNQTDSPYLVSGSNDHTAQVWEAGTGKRLLTYRRHTNSVEAVAWSPDGKRIASAGADTTVQVWEAATGSRLQTYTGHQDGVNAIAWSPHGNYIASGSDDATVQVWRAS